MMTDCWHTRGSWLTGNDLAMEWAIVIMHRLNMKAIGVMINDTEGESCTIEVANWWKKVNGGMERNVALNTSETEANQSISESNTWNWKTRVYWVTGMYRGSINWNRSKSVMIVSELCKHSRSKDWSDWKVSKSATTRLLKWKKDTGILKMPTTNRDHSTYWIVNRWNRFKSVSIVLVILEEDLNWVIWNH